MAIKHLVVRNGLASSGTIGFLITRGLGALGAVTITFWSGLFGYRQRRTGGLY